MDADFIGKAAMKKIAEQGVSRKQVGLEIDGEPLAGANNEFWPIIDGSEQIGCVTSAIYSPRLQANIALAIVSIDFSALGTEAEIVTPFGRRSVKVVPKPFYDPRKAIAAKS
jgi:aminomethyltransferase